jgi:Uma2 family endonuclease
MSRMDPALPNEAADPRMTIDEYLGLVDQGLLEPDDRVELLDGVVVAMAPPNPPHCGNTDRVVRALRRAVGSMAHVREEKPLALGRYSLPEPDASIVAIDPFDYTRFHPTTAFLVVEVADSSLPQDRLSKARIYAGAGIPEYWIVNLRHGHIEILRDPDASHRLYREKTIVGRGTHLTLVALPDATVFSDDLLSPV